MGMGLCAPAPTRGRTGSRLGFRGWLALGPKSQSPAITGPRSLMALAAPDYSWPWQHPITHGPGSTLGIAAQVEQSVPQLACC